ncbi:MAG: cation transporter [Wenzhouxiangella sp.]|nr:MAG: cation transporter [Wenzhouxiangella sp.]
MRYVISLSLLLVVLWLAISGVYKPLLFVLGGASVILVVWLSVRMDVVGVEHNPVLFSWRLVVYWGWLMGQLIKSNLHVSRLVFQTGKVKPRLLSVPVPHEAAVSKVTYGNSVTLTPGTVTLKLTDHVLEAHALDEESARELEAGHMARKICWLERQGEKEN